MEHILAFLSAPNFEHFLDAYGIIGIFIWFVTFDQLTPIPEEISLLTIGYLASNGAFNPLAAGLVSLVALLSVDIAYYFLSRKGSMLLGRRKKSGSPFIRKYKAKLAENMPKTLVVLSFIPRMRMWGPILIGSMRLPFEPFLFYDALGLAAFVAIYLSLGYFFHASLAAALVTLAPALHNWIFFGVLLVVAYVLLYINHRLNRAEK